MWTDRYLGLRYVDGGRALGGVDCLGLYALILVNEAETAMPGFAVSAGTDPARAVNAIEGEIVSGRWRRIYGEPAMVAQKFDCVRMTGHARGADGVVRRSDIHLGCAVGDGTMIHIESNKGCRVVRLDDPSVIKRVVGVYRPLFLCMEAA